MKLSIHIVLCKIDAQNTALRSQCLAYVHHFAVSAFRSLMAEGIKVHKCVSFCDLAAELRPFENSGRKLRRS